MDDVPVIDRARLELISRGNAALADEFLAALMLEADELLEQLGPLIEAGTRLPVSDVAHTLKGMATEVGATRLRAAAAALEAETERTRWPEHAGRITAALAELREVGGAA